MRDPYAILGVRRNAGQDEIKAAWRSVAKAVHPDHNQDDPLATQRFAEAGKAYELLRDPVLRSRYDRVRREAELRRMEAMKQKMRGPEPAEEPVDAETAEEAISRIFGVEPQAQPSPSKPKAAPQRPVDKGEAPADTRTEAVADSKREEASRLEATALRRSAAPAADLVAAIVRRIRGRIAKPAEKVPDLAVDVNVSIEQVVNRARLSVELPDGETVKLSIPPGTTDGQAIRLKEQGYRVTGMARGDVLATLRINQEGPFRTQGLDLVTTLPLDLEDAVLGCDTVLETPSGSVTVTVPAWSGSDKVIRIAGAGLRGADGEAGDLLVELRLMLREKPDDKVTDLMRSLRHGLYL
ncbi:DnaJ C-terminal domain-containing protein [Sinorhizobium terangae]|uniref:DnaJ domain-containing protein n=1 Tax=Sinorhizobium terangae TaxID=110322 RepID=A0A6N7LLE5_SINTE|nr:DnaJ C-terminal domain-containing protein [Sinorhizobium terangae]MBB4184846.1 DnaJ-class molecular chaperone [Sinorhizobium terangae]MQX18466.1 DnaJ domain-containing protein [Sinorhizobium terangae]WFU48326.1 DnaJ C-terminal domain-containing protein [Sinorhizobium terangae]